MDLARQSTFAIIRRRLHPQFKANRWSDRRLAAETGEIRFYKRVIPVKQLALISVD